MGLAVLPARLREEMDLLGKAIVAGRDIRQDETLAKHADWVEGFLPGCGTVTQNNVTEILHREIGLVFMRVLEDAGVYKRTPEGQAAFDRFVAGLNN